MSKQKKSKKVTGKSTKALSVSLSNLVRRKKCIRGYALFVTSDAEPKGWIHNIFSWGEHGGNYSAKSAYRLAKEYIETHKKEFWYFNTWKIKLVRTFFSA